MPGLMAWLGLDASAFQRGMMGAKHLAREAGAEIKSSLGEGVTGVLKGFGAAAGVAGIAELVHHAMEAAEHIRQLSAEFRVSTDTIQIWEKGAHDAGTTVEDIGNAMNRLKKARDTAKSEGDPGGFSAFGITLMELNDQAITTEQIMDRIRESTAGHPITDQEDVAAMELMGKGGAKVLSAMQQIHEMGPIPLMNNEEIEQLHAANEELEDIKRKITIITAHVLSAVPQAAKGWADFFAGRASFNDMFRSDETGNVAAPTTDLKGRPLKGATHSAAAVSTTTSIKAQKSEAKDIVDLQKEREALEDKVFKNHLKTLSVMQQQLELKKLIAEHEKNANLASRIGNEHLSIKERMEAENLRGQLANSHKSERMDFNSLEKIGAFSNVGALNSNPAAQTAKHTADTFRAVESLVGLVRGYVLKKGERSRVDITRGGVHFE